MLVKDEFPSYRQYLFAGQKAPGTIAQRVGDLERFERLTESDVEEATPAILLEYMADHYATWAPQYSKRIRASFRSYFQWRAMAVPGAVDASCDLPSVKIPDEYGVNPIVIIGRLQKAGDLDWRSALVKGAPNVDGILREWK